MKKYLILLVLAYLPTFIFGQNQMLSVEDAIMKANTTLAPANLQGLQWRSNDTYTFIQDNTLKEFSVNGKLERKLLDVQHFNAYLKGMKLDTVKNLPNPVWISGGKGYFLKDTLLLLYNISETKEKISESWLHANSIAKNADNIDIDKSSLNIAYTLDNNLFIALRSGKNKQITHNENKGIVNGTSVHRDEFGIKKGTYWSPSGKLLAFYRMDQSMVTDYPIVDLNLRPAKAEEIKYPMAGMKSHEVTVGVYNSTTEKTIFLKTGEPKEQYLTNITWSPDEKYIYIQVLNRAQNHMWLNKYDAMTGEFVKTLFEEKNDKFVEPLNPLYFLKTQAHEFIYFSQRDGWMHLYKYNDEGKLIGQLTKGAWIVEDILGTDPNEKYIYFHATKESPVDIAAFRLNLSTLEINKVSQGTGMHTALLSPDAKYILDKYSNARLPRQINLINTSGVQTKTLLTADNPLKDYKLGETKLLTNIKAADGTPLYARIILPPGFDATKKYPSVTYLYNGPHAQMVTNNWLCGSNLWMQYMAQQGFIVFTIDGRGSANRGLVFEQATFRHLGDEEMADQLKGNEYLRSLPYIDTARMGIHGWSFGGFMTTTMMLKAPGTYKVGVAGGPVIDWKYYEIMYTERYMDTPEENKEGFDKANLLNYVKNLRGKLLMIHGTSDPVVVWQHSLMFVKKCVDEGKQLDYFVYPGHPHNVLGKDRVHLMTKISEYFKSNL